MPFKVSIHRQIAPCFLELQHYIRVVRHPTSFSALKTRPVRLWPRFGQVLEEPDTACDGRPDVNTEAFEAWGEIWACFSFVSFQNADAS